MRHRRGQRRPFTGGGVGLWQQGPAGKDHHDCGQDRRHGSDGRELRPVGEFLMFSKQPIPPRRVWIVSSTGSAAPQVTDRCPVTKKGGAQRPALISARAAA